MLHPVTQEEVKPRPGTRKTRWREQL
jgi:hypothetical protein